MNEEQETLNRMVATCVQEAQLSPCQSKRGAIVFDQRGVILSYGHNDQPLPFMCTGRDDCKKNCGKTAVHAEQAAILGLSTYYHGELSMMHVKAVDGYSEMPKASGPPSCPECSKLILARGIEFMYLLADPTAELLHGAEVIGETVGAFSGEGYGHLQIRRYTAAAFHRLTAEFHKIGLVRK